ncbi:MULTISPECIES: hypothetical protein [unclassified Synechococcus]|uniref:hypothetical protein n=1 Tax=unclassified Synechococcus TaxID=2626047 RepID=UPI0039AEFCF4
MSHHFQATAQLTTQEVWPQTAMEKPFDKFANTKIFIIKPSKNSVLNSVHLQHSKKVDTLAFCLCFMAL